MKEIIPLLPNIGGMVSPKNVIGRDVEINNIWNILEKQGIALFAERCFGKSSILRKMADEPKDGFIVIYKPVEGISTANNFASQLLLRVKELDLIDESFSKKIEDFYNTATDLVDEIQGVKIKKVRTFVAKAN